MRTTLEEFAREAGEILSRYFRNLKGFEEKADHKGFVTEADLASEKRVKELINAKFPSHAILAEESGLSGLASLGAGPAVPMWFIDPLDGTNNFAHGNPYHCVSIAFGDSTGEISSAVVYQPFTKLMFSADRGQGAYCNGERIRLGGAGGGGGSMAPVKFETGAYATGWASASGKDLEKITTQILKVQSECASTAVRMNGAAALDMALTAWGSFDGFWERHLNPWDTAAGQLLIEESGGRVINSKGERYNCLRDNLVVAGRVEIVERLLDLVKD